MSEEGSPSDQCGESSANERRRLSSAFGDEPALIPYITAGDPAAEATKEFVESLERGGADAIELGLPFSEPIAEGPTIQNAIFRALDAGMTPDRFFDLVDELAVDVPLIVMTYYNLIFQYGDSEGPRDFVRAADGAGLSGIIVPDLPIEESGPLRDACDEYDLDLVCIVAPTTDGERLTRIMETTSGFAYVQARLGTTGARTDVSGETFDSLTRLDNYDVPKAVGFGVSEPEHARAIVEGGADGVIVGSALVDKVAECSTTDRRVAAVADELEETVAGLKEGANISPNRSVEPQHR